MGDPLGLGGGQSSIDDEFDGARHVSQCLIVASHEENGEFKFEFKRNTAAHDIAPVDFEKDLNAPIALIT